MLNFETKFAVAFIIISNVWNYVGSLRILELKIILEITQTMYFIREMRNLLSSRILALPNRAN